MSAFTKEGNIACLGIFPGTVEKFDEEKKKDKDSASREIILVKDSSLLKNLRGDEEFCFNSSYYLPVNQNTSAVSGHAPIFSAAVEKNQFYGVQFLPEESGDAGLHVLKNFAGL